MTRKTIWVAHVQFVAMPLLIGLSWHYVFFFCCPFCSASLEYRAILFITQCCFLSPQWFKFRKLCSVSISLCTHCTHTQKHFYFISMPFSVSVLRAHFCAVYFLKPVQSCDILNPWTLKSSFQRERMKEESCSLYRVEQKSVEKNKSEIVAWMASKSKEFSCDNDNFLLVCWSQPVTIESESVEWKHAIEQT